MEPSAESVPGRAAQLAAALTAVRERMDRAARGAGRDPAGIELLPVTKFFPAADVLELYRLGCRAFGESRDQEASGKVAAVGRPDIRWHMVGNIQRNKAKSVARWAYCVHSVDSSGLVSALGTATARALDSQQRLGPLRAYVQVSLDGDTTRGGVDIGDRAAVDSLCAQVAASAQLELAGLMALPPRDADSDGAFARLQQEHDRVRTLFPEADGLSAGMSDDLESAIKYGSTCVRVGTALMGQRRLTSR